MPPGRRDDPSGEYSAARAHAKAADICPPLCVLGYGVSRSVIEEAPQLAAAARMLELAQRLRLDLADALAGHRELLADLLQRVVGVHADAEAHAQHALFTWRQ